MATQRGVSKKTSNCSFILELQRVTVPVVFDCNVSEVVIWCLCLVACCNISTTLLCVWTGATDASVNRKNTICLSVGCLRFSHVTHLVCHCGWLSGCLSVSWCVCLSVFPPVLQIAAQCHVTQICSLGLLLSI